MDRVVVRLQRGAEVNGTPRVDGLEFGRRTPNDEQRVVNADGTRQLEVELKIEKKLHAAASQQVGDLTARILLLETALRGWLDVERPIGYARKFVAIRKFTETLLDHAERGPRCPGDGCQGCPGCWSTDASVGDLKRSAG